MSFWPRALGLCWAKPPGCQHCLDAATSAYRAQVGRPRGTKSEGLRPVANNEVRNNPPLQWGEEQPPFRPQSVSITVAPLPQPGTTATMGTAHVNGNGTS